jgi:hypothetical protein
MLEDKEPKNAQDWHDQVSTFVKGVVSLRAKKTSAKDIARVLKDRSFEELLGYPSCRVLENLEKSQFKAEAPHSPILEQFEDIYKQATQLNVAIQAIDPQTISENEARELITNIVELKVIYPLIAVMSVPNRCT